jgi:hypothetical protein
VEGKEEGTLIPFSILQIHATRLPRKKNVSVALLVLVFCYQHVKDRMLVMNYEL